MTQTILVTGSTSGFGRLTVETLARQGDIVFAGMRAIAGKNAAAAEELRALAQHEQLALHIVEIDITDDASVVQAIASVIAITGRLDVVVNNTGISSYITNWSKDFLLHPCLAHRTSRTKSSVCT